MLDRTAMRQNEGQTLKLEYLYYASYRPWRIIWLTTLLTVSTGILKPIPADAPEGLYIAML